MTVEMIVDLQFGSTGKGLIAGYLAETNTELPYDVVVNCNMPNAGHTYIDSMGNKFMHKVLPNGVVGPGVEYALIGPGSVFSPNQLAAELTILAEHGYSNFDVIIHPNAVILKPEDVSDEKHMVPNIGSTAQGSMAAQIRKMRRNGADECLARHRYKYVQSICRDMPVSVVHNNDYDMIVDQASRILAEGSQGHSLGINEPFWPYTTSRPCEPGRFLSDMGIPWDMLTDVIGTCRLHPIRVGGNSGPCFPDQEEITWKSLDQDPEFTTVTGRQRRVFTFSREQVARAIHHCSPSAIFINFCNYAKTTSEILSVVGHLFDCTQVENVVEWCGWGPTYHDVHRVTSEEHKTRMGGLVDDVYRLQTNH